MSVKHLYMRAWSEEIVTALQVIYDALPDPVQTMYRNADGTLNESALLRYSVLTLAKSIREVRDAR